jgi:hypothetical protein
MNLAEPRNGKSGKWCSKARHIRANGFAQITLKGYTAAAESFPVVIIVAEGERLAGLDVFEDNSGDGPLVGIFVVGQILGEDLQFGDFPPLAQPFRVRDGCRRWCFRKGRARGLHGFCSGKELEKGSADHGGWDFGISACDGFWGLHRARNK